MLILGLEVQLDRVVLFILFLPVLLLALICFTLFLLLLVLLLLLLIALIVRLLSLCLLFLLLDFLLVSAIPKDLTFKKSLRACVLALPVHKLMRIFGWTLELYLSR